MTCRLFDRLLVESVFLRRYTSGATCSVVPRSALLFSVEPARGLAPSSWAVPGLNSTSSRDVSAPRAGGRTHFCHHRRAVSEILCYLCRQTSVSTREMP